MAALCALSFRLWLSLAAAVAIGHPGSWLLMFMGLALIERRGLR